MEGISPTSSHVLWDGAMEVHCFGTASGDWSLKGYERAGSEERNPGIGAKIDGLLPAHRVGRLYMPSPHRFNAALAWTEDLTVAWKPGLIFRGVDAEGVLLGKLNEACGLASGDCPTIVARNRKTGLSVAAHAGRESLYDKEYVVMRGARRKHPSVVDAIVEAIGPGPDLDVFIACGIQAACFTHVSDERNEAMLKHFRETCRYPCVSKDGRRSLALDLVIMSQFEAHGVHPGRIVDDGVCTYEDMTQADGYRWHSHRRDKDGRRNFVLAIRRK